MKKTIALALLLMVAIGLRAQIMDPVKFTAKLVTHGSADAEIVFSGKIDKGWHVYSTGLGNDGPTSATLSVNSLSGVELVGGLKAVGREISAYDKLFEMKLRYFEGSATFVQKVKFSKPAYHIDVYLTYGACSDQVCLPPSEVDFKQQGKSPAVDKAAADEAKKEDAKAAEAQAAPAESASLSDTAATLLGAALQPVDSLHALTTAADSATLWKPVVKQLQQTGNGNPASGHSLLGVFLLGLVGGLLALVMPCIWPIIPMTVSFFLKRSKDNRRRGIGEAVTYGLSIIVIFLALGLGVTALCDPWTLNSLSTNAVFNLILFALLVVFALSFFGWFEIRLPNSWADKVDSKAGKTTGLVSIFLMAFTLVLVSFSCTAPIVGLLLVQAITSGSWLAPAVGMFGFALALAVPFSLFAMFPALMKKSPKGGAWMNRVKVVLGFVELAFALKFFSVADLAYGWHLMDREVFLSLWIVIFGALGAYLVGWLRFPSDAVGGDEPSSPRSVGSIMLGLCSMAFAVYMVPGLWGAPCKAVSAFAPPMTTQDFNLNSHVVRAAYTDYDLGMAAARAEGKPVMIDFTGFGCVNCRKMEAAVWTDPAVAKKLENDYVLISLYVDDKHPLPRPITVTDVTGKQRTLRTVGDKWSFLQSYKFGANAQPFYVTLDNDGNPLSGPFAYKEDVAAYMQFLDQGLERYKEK